VGRRHAAPHARRRRPGCSTSDGGRARGAGDPTSDRPATRRGKLTPKKEASALSFCIHNTLHSYPNSVSLSLLFFCLRSPGPRSLQPISASPPPHLWQWRSLSIRCTPPTRWPWTSRTSSPPTCSS
jgi:hypothetical protein